MAHRILYMHPQSKLKAWPRDWLIRYTNGSEECDMLVGPCSCGAWHDANEWSDPNGICSRKIMGVPVFEFYDAEIRDYPENPSREIMLEVLGADEVARLDSLPPLTLSFF